MVAELLGTWLRVEGTGTISRFRRKAVWLSRTADIDVDSQEAGRWLRDVSARGYLEVDWDQDRWSCTPTVLTRLPQSDGLAVLVGFTTAAQRAALEELDAEVHDVPEQRSGGNARMRRPAATFIQYEAMRDLPQLAADLDASYVPCAATQLAALLLPPKLDTLAAPPSTLNETLVKLVPTELTWSPITAPLSPGLHRYESAGRKHHLWFDGGDWRHCRLEAGVWFALRVAGVSAVRWRPYEGQDPASGVGQLFSDWGAPLPDLHRRALVLCSGRSPRFSGQAFTASYENVPRAVAEKVCSTIGQPFKTS